jgi:RNA polymerase sigma-70 factor, ECF subfamily
MSIFDDSDELLMEKVAEGDSAAFQELYMRYKNDTFGLACRMMGSKIKAEDIMQEAWMKVIEKAETFQATGSLKAWLMTIVRNMCLNELGKNKNNVGDLPLAEMADHTENFEFSEEFWRQQEIELVKKAIDLLPDRQRIAISLQYIEELDMRQIGEIMKVDIEAVKALLFRARQNIAKNLINLRKEKSS